MPLGNSEETLGRLEGVGIDVGATIFNGCALGTEEGGSDGILLEGDALGIAEIRGAGDALGMLGRDEEGKFGSPGFDGALKSEGGTLGIEGLVGWIDVEGMSDSVSRSVGLDGLAVKPVGLADGLRTIPVAANIAAVVAATQAMHKVAVRHNMPYSLPMYPATLVVAEGTQ